MIEQTFEQLNAMMSISPIAALVAAFIWGILSVLLSPCHLAGIPLIIAYVNNQQTNTPRQATLLSMLFAVGILLTMVTIGTITAYAGRIAGDIGSVGGYLISVIFLLIGLHLLDAISIPWFGTKKEKVQKKGAIGALLLGLMFGIASGPCTFAFLAPVLAIVFSAADSGIIFSISLLTFYALGHSLVLIIAGISTERIQKIKKWNHENAASKWIKTICGILLIVAGFYFLYQAI